MVLLAYVVIIALTLLRFQQSHYAFLRESREHKDTLALAAHLEEKLELLDAVKKQVDALVLRSGFSR